jgi:hypothetical protein
MAHSASGRFSSEYHTASSEGFDPQHEALNSTVAFNEQTQGSAEMSIESCSVKMEFLLSVAINNTR